MNSIHQTMRFLEIEFIFFGRPVLIFECTQRRLVGFINTLKFREFTELTLMDIKSNLLVIT